MKLVVVGFGQCGCNIADEFYTINRHARSLFGRRIEIVTDAFAVNTDEADLGGFKNIPKDRNHRILIGSIRTLGHGVGKINTEAARIIRESHSIASDTILRSREFHECDAIIAVASGGGGTGSGTIGWSIKELKERIDKPVYAIIVLPFRYEERGEASFSVLNSATCIKTVEQYADAVFLADNDRFRKTGNSLAQNFREMNQEIVGSFFDLCCAGEERNRKYLGSKVIDAGDIKQSLEGISTIGRGQTDLSAFYRWLQADFRTGVQERSASAGALRQAENCLGIKVQLEDARKILALVTGPRDALAMPMLEEVSTYLQEKSPKSVVRIGDYPRRAKEFSVTIIASRLTKVNRLESLYLQAEDILRRKQDIDSESERTIERMRATSDNLPLLS